MATSKMKGDVFDVNKVLDLCATHRTYTQADLEYKRFDNAMDKEHVKGE